MLEEINIKNAALIENAHIEFSGGLNILSGETGAGKSMIIGSLAFVLGQRSTRDFIREGEKKAVVEAVFSHLSQKALDTAVDMGIDCDEGVIILQRTINSDGKTNGRINGTPVTASMLRRLAESLVDIYSQHEHQSLLNTSNHIDILDSFCENSINGFKEQLLEYIREYKDILKKLEAVSGDEFERQRKIDFLEYKIEEIENAGLKSGEEEELNQRKKTLMFSEKLVKYSKQCLELLYYGGDEGVSACDKAGEALRLCSIMEQSDDSVEEIRSTLESAFEQLKEAVSEMKVYAENLDEGPDEINNIESRLDIIYNLKRKYGSTIEEIIEAGERAKSELEFINNSSKIRDELNYKRKEVLKNISKICSKITRIREETALTLQKNITDELRSLEMKNAVFKICVKQKDGFGPKGQDDVEFMISTNAGEGLKPLAKTASGGEMSRVMLGLKAVTAAKESIGAYVFDEIDTGIGGKTAGKVAEKMALISKNQQIICITHLPQIASMADRHFLIEKSVYNDKTSTSVKCLDYNERVFETARLMSGEETKSAVKAAKDMVDIYDKRKKELRK